MSVTESSVKFDPFGLAFRNDPNAWYPKLFEASPGFMELDGVPSAYVAKFSQVRVVMRDPLRFSSVKPKGLPGMERVDFFNGQTVMTYSDAPDHLRLRRVVNGAFLPHRIAELAAPAARIIDELLGQVEEGVSIDVVAEITKKMAVKLLLGEFLGVAEKDWPIFQRFTATLSLLDEVRPGGEKPQAYLDAWKVGAEYCREAVARAGHEENRSLIGVVAQAGGEGGPLSDGEMMGMMVLLFIGGVGTVSPTIASSLLNISRHPDVAKRVREEPAAAALVLEESMRLDPPVTLVMRFCTRDTEVDGITIRGGTPVYTMIGAANHDPDVWPEPLRFNIDRQNLKDHVAFGYGVHTCIGNAITRLTVPLLIAAVARRFPNLRVSDPTAALVWETTPRSRHLGSLRMTF
jgi:cytochrome P450